MQKRIFIIIPCYNEAKRLNVSLFKSCDPAISFMFVNDGSCDGTKLLLEQNFEDCHHVLNLEKNVGKAEAVRQGFLRLKSMPDFNEAEWVGYWDADLSTPLSEIRNFIKFADFYDNNVDAIFGSRVLRLGGNIKRNLIRHLLGRLFCSVMDMLFHFRCYDTQCGAKLFKCGAAEKAFQEPFVSRWIFDIEVLLRLRGCRQIEYPLKSWQDIGGSKIKLFGTFFRVVADIVRIYVKY